MKKVLLIAIITLVMVSVITVPAVADKASPKLLLTFTDDSDQPVDNETNIMLNEFTVITQKLLDKATPVLMKMIDKSSPQLLRMDKSTPKLMKAYDKATPILMGFSEDWIRLAQNIEEGAYSSEIARLNDSAAGTIEISSDDSTVRITGTLKTDDDMYQTITMTYEKIKDEWFMIIGGGKGGIGGMLGYEFYLKLEGEK
jgi:type VI protein secretion system component Hcp